MVRAGEVLTYHKPLSDKPLSDKPLSDKPLSDAPLSDAPRRINTLSLNGSQDNVKFKDLLRYNDDVYETDPNARSWLASRFPTTAFYRKFIWNVYRSSVKARRGEYDDQEWARTSHQVLQALESVGVRAVVSGIDNVRRLDTPCVFVANHMSMLETIVLPSIIRPIRPVTFVVKQSLLEYPLFRHIARARDPIAVSRNHPREDFKAVMEGGIERLSKGISIVVFPQTTRSLTFDPTEFNTIGVKLALKAGIPVVPIALKTDAWANGTRIKDLGPIDPKKTVYFSFGRPIAIRNRGAEQHREIIEFIESNLKQW
jgi:1-acyl-sn-glycerol-3-phosphate acyltransferase